MRPLLLLFALCLSAWADALIGTVVKVIDGDTFTLLVDKTQHKVRMDAIDAPESKQPFGEASRKSLANLIAGKKVTVKWQKRDRYQRILGRVILDGDEINILQISFGMAWHYAEFNKEARFINAHNTAKARKIGLWADPNPVPPWTFRKEKK